MSDPIREPPAPAADGMMRIYVAGPITRGDQLANVAAGIRAAHELLSLGFVPFSPHAMSALWHMMYPRTWDEWLAYDEHWVAACHAVLRLPGESSGADREATFAERRGIPVFGTIEELVRYREGRDGRS